MILDRRIWHAKLRPASWLYLFALIGWMVPAIGAAQTAPLRLTSESGNPSLAGHLSVLVDRAGQLSHEQVVARQAAGEFAPLADNNTAAGFLYPGAFWVHLTLDRSAQKPEEHWILSISQDWIDEIDLYVQQTDGSYLHKKGGRFFPVVTREFSYSGHAFRLPPHSDRQEIYLRLESLASLRFAVNIYQESIFERFRTQDNFFFGFFFGLMTLVMLASVYRAIRHRTLVDGCYAMYITALELSNFTGFGFFQIFVGSDNWLLRLAIAQSGLVLAGISLVWLFVLIVEWPAQIRQRVNRVAAGFTLGYLLMMLIVLILTPRSTFYWTTVISGWLLSGVLLANLWGAWRGWMHARLFLWVFLPFLFSAITIIMANIGFRVNFYLFRDLSFLTTIFHAAFMFLVIFGREVALQQERDRLRGKVDQLIDESSNQTLFMRMLSHEVRTPLAIIDSNSQLLQMQNDGNSRRMSLLEEVRASTTRIADLLDRCLAQDRQASLTNIHKVPVDLGGLITELAKSVQQQTEDHLLITRIGELPPKVWVDPELFRILLLNLLENAILYSPDGGTIEIAAYVDKNGRVIVEVADEGVGIPPSELEHIFERYFRTHQVEAATGTGLGLYIVKNIASLHGAEVVCESTLGESSMFRVTLA